jgi:hypothetical protein
MLKQTLAALKLQLVKCTYGFPNRARDAMPAALCQQGQALYCGAVMGALPVGCPLMYFSCGTGAFQVCIMCTNQYHHEDTPFAGDFPGGWGLGYFVCAV